VRLLLARHGESVWNAERRFQGRTDIALSARGRAQAEALGRALRGYRLAAAYVSPFRRARETAELALAGTRVPLIALDELRELSLGEWEGCTVDEVRAREGDPYRAWLLAPHDCPPPGGEPLPVVSERVRAAMEHIAAAHPNGEDVLVVAHGGVISVYACALLGCSFNSLWRLRVDNASLTVVRPPRLVSLNDTAHLPAALATATHVRASIAGGSGLSDAAGGAAGSVREASRGTPHRAGVASGADAPAATGPAAPAELAP
jgi:broad specificity phosphatase PhoE